MEKIREDKDVEKVPAAPVDHAPIGKKIQGEPSGTIINDVGVGKVEFNYITNTWRADGAPNRED
jgi:hypothetical protein